MITKLDKKLEGLPNNTLSLLLILAGIVAWIVAIYGNPTLKVAVLGWMLIP